MPNRFPLNPVALTSDPFCTDDFCSDSIVVTAQITGGNCQGYPVDVANWNNYYIGTTVTVSNISCAGATVRWYNSAGQLQSTGSSITLGCGAPGGLYYVVTCPDGSKYTSPTKSVYFPEFWFDDAPILSAAYSFEYSRTGTETTSCTGFYGPPNTIDISYGPETVAIGIVNTARLRMATPETAPNSTNETGVLFSPLVAIDVCCENPGNWISANFKTRLTRINGTVFDIYHGGGDFMTNYDKAYASSRCVIPLSIVLTGLPSPGLGVPGDDVFWCGLRNYDAAASNFYRAKLYQFGAC